MPMQPINPHHRKSIRLKEYDLPREITIPTNSTNQILLSHGVNSSPGEYFVTVCTFNKQCTLGEIINELVCLSPAGDIIKRHWEEIPKHFQNVELDEFIIMPNHIHGIIVLTEPVGAIHESPLPMTQRQRRTMTLSKIIGRFKMSTAKEINILRKTPGSHVWQRNYSPREI
jgi:REP element-mobilizing transposase RayT